MSKKFEIDVLIIAADQDNKSTNDSTGWVSQFKRFLELMLTQVLGTKPNVIIKGEHDNITSPNLDNAAVLVTILSEEFIESGSCLDHLEAFVKASNGISSKQPRIFKVFKNQLTPSLQPPRIRELIGYELFQVDPDSGEIKEYTDYFTSDAERQYWMKMVDLAYDIYDTLMVLSGESQPLELKRELNRKTIYVAETGHDLSVQRNIIKRELQRHGYVVLPNHTLHDQITQLEQEVKNDLNESDLSIHLIGSSYGAIPNGSNISIVDIQNSLAAERSIQAKEKGSTFTRLIWISPNLANSSERQKDFIEKLKRDVESQEGAEILQTPLEDFKNIMREELLESRETKTETKSDGLSVYLVHDKVDSKAVTGIVDTIKGAGFEVILPKFEGELLELRKDHINNLRKFDAAIIYKGKVNEQWVRMKILDLLKAPGFGRQKPILGKAIIAGSNSNINNESFQGQDLRIITGDDSHEYLKSYLQEFKN